MPALSGRHVLACVRGRVQRVVPRLPGRRVLRVRPGGQRLHRMRHLRPGRLPVRRLQRHAKRDLPALLGVVRRSLAQPVHQRGVRAVPGPAGGDLRHRVLPLLLVLAGPVRAVPVHGRGLLRHDMLPLRGVRAEPVLQHALHGYGPAQPVHRGELESRHAHPGHGRRVLRVQGLRQRHLHALPV